MRFELIPHFQKKLLGWYQKNARDLPWRKTKNPYAIWVSEIMLQQTQVKTVIPYYERWMKRFPSLQSLAEAPQEEVLKYWAGLGYYRRARMLHEAAGFVMTQLHGKIPQAAADLQKIPGIGRYTAGAIASIAFEEKVPILDGNVIRILTRIFALNEDIGLPSTINKLWILAEKILPNRFLGDFNQALMELGATVCFPQSPSCLLCPVASLCKASKINPEKFPVKKQKDVLEKIETAALILRQKGKVLVQKQPEKERWGGLWMFPHWKSKEEMLAEARRCLPAICKAGKVEVKPIMQIRHGFTRYQVTLNVYEGQETRGKEQQKRNSKNGKHFSFPLPPAPRPLTRWVSLKDLSSLAFPSPHQKIVKELLKP